LAISACGETPENLSTVVDDGAQTAAAETVTTPVEATVIAVNALNGEWQGGWGQKFTPTSSNTYLGEYCIQDANGNPIFRVITVKGKLTIDGNTAVFSGTVTDQAKKIRAYTNGQKYCNLETVETAVSQSLAMVTTSTSAAIFCIAPDCGAGKGDWRVGPQDTFAAIAGKLTATGHIVDGVNTLFTRFDFVKK
jgi:hypothetical protein